VHPRSSAASFTPRSAALIPQAGGNHQNPEACVLAAVIGASPPRHSSRSSWRRRGSTRDGARPLPRPAYAESATFRPIGRKYQTLIGVCSKLCVDNRSFDSQLCANRGLACSQLCATSASRSVDDRGRCSRVCVNRFMRHEVANSAQCDSQLSRKQVSSGGLHARH
jgi:hypothetical protein